MSPADGSGGGEGALELTPAPVQRKSDTAFRGRAVPFLNAGTNYVQHPPWYFYMRITSATLDSSSCMVAGSWGEQHAQIAPHPKERRHYLPVLLTIPPGSLRPLLQGQARQRELA